MSEELREEGIYFGFWGSVILKGLISLTETIVGFTLFFVPTATLIAIATTILQSGLLGSETGFVAHLFQKTIEEFTHGTQVFVAGYLLVRGIVKMAVLIALMQNKLWAYPASLAVLGALVLFQIYQIATTHSITVLAITIFDLIVMYFIWSEYKIVKIHHGLRKEHFEPTGTV